MNQVIELLEDRNLHLEKFFELTEIQMARFAVGSFEDLDQFYGQREAILSLIKCIDSLIHTEVEARELDPVDRLAAAQLVKEKESLVKKIVAQDLQVLELIEKYKSSLLKELATVKTGRKALISYQSGSVRSNERLKSQG